jgi:hypothetical protein
MTNNSVFFSETEMEELFTMGILGGAGKKGKSQDELMDISKKSLSKIGGGGKSPVTGQDKADVEAKGKTFHHWYRAHNGAHQGASLTLAHTQKVPPGSHFDCNLLTDEWFKWFLTTPRSRNPYSNPGEGDKDEIYANQGEEKRHETELYGRRNVFLMEKRNIHSYFTTAAPFQEPDMKTITLTKEGHLLVPAYNIFASEEMFPSLDTKNKLLLEVVSDLFGIIYDEVLAEFDGQTIEPCCVIRKEPLAIRGIPNDNVIGISQDRLNEFNSSINILHGGFWILIKQEALTSGDHLLEWQVNSINYKMHAEIRINNLV